MTTSRPARGLTIEAHNLTKLYSGAAVVDSLSFVARPGVITGFLGPNGAGKSTTMRMLLGLAAPTRGSVTIGNQHISQLQHPGRTIGALIDARAVHPRRSAFAHLLAYAQAMGLKRDRVAEVLNIVDLTKAARRPAGEFSLGMNQRLGIATALLGDPSVLVLDEPLNGLDPEGIRWMRTFMRDLAAEGRTVLFSSHLMLEMELTADELIVISGGRLLASASLDEFVREHTSRTVVARTDSANSLARALKRAGVAVSMHGDQVLRITDTDARDVGAIAASEKIALNELTTVRDSLEDVFLRLTHDAPKHEETAA